VGGGGAFFPDLEFLLLYGQEKIYGNFSSNFNRIFHLNLLSGYLLFLYLSVMNLIYFLGEGRGTSKAIGLN
jgi:hypothetical protein